MRTIKIPKFFHEVFGKESTVAELTMILVFTLLSTGLLFTKTYVEWNGFEVYQIVIIFLLAIDINGGVIANFTYSTNNQYKASVKGRLIFITIHIQPLILAFVLREYYLPCALVWIYTVISALIVNGNTNHPAQRTLGAIFMASGILWLILFFSTLPKFLLIILIFYLIKVSFSFAVDHYAERKA